MKYTEYFYSGETIGSGKVGLGKPKKYLCPKHGEIENTMYLTLQGIETNYCMQCYIQFLRDNLPIVEEI